MKKWIFNKYSLWLMALLLVQVYDWAIKKKIR